MNKTRDSRATVLVIEDIGWIRAGMKSSLKFYGHLVLEAADDEEAIEIGSRIHLDLILTEEELPTFDALRKRLREHPTLRHVPVVIVNPDAKDGTRYGEVKVIPGYNRIGSLLATQRSWP